MMSSYNHLPGTHLVTTRGLYTHHGIYIGNGQVIHYSGLANGFESGDICQTSLEEFENGCPSSVRHHKNAFAPEIIIQRAQSRLGEDEYHLVTNNCEHFANWCVEGRHYSEQIHTAIQAAKPGIKQFRQLIAEYPKTATALLLGAWLINTQ